MTRLYDEGALINLRP